MAKVNLVPFIGFVIALAKPKILQVAKQRTANARLNLGRLAVGFVENNLYREEP